MYFNFNYFILLLFACLFHQVKSQPLTINSPEVYEAQAVKLTANDAITYSWNNCSTSNPFTISSITTTTATANKGTITPRELIQLTISSDLIHNQIIL